MPALQIHSNGQARNLSSTFYNFPQGWISLTLGYAFSLLNAKKGFSI